MKAIAFPIYWLLVALQDKYEKSNISFSVAFSTIVINIIPVIILPVESLLFSSMNNPEMGGRNDWVTNDIANRLKADIRFVYFCKID